MTAPALVQLLRERRSHYNLKGARREIIVQEWADADGMIHLSVRVEVQRFRPLNSEGPKPAQFRALRKLERKIYGR